MEKQKNTSKDRDRIGIEIDSFHVIQICAARHNVSLLTVIRIPGANHLRVRK